MANQFVTLKQEIPSGDKFPGSGNPCRPTQQVGFRQFWILPLIVGLYFAALRQAAGAISHAAMGEFGGDLNLLASFCSGPKGPGESNYYIDMWAGQYMEQIARLNGLTNNHALFINSHGKGIREPGRNRFGFYAHQKVLKGKAESRLYSVRDLAEVLGGEKAAAIHNVYVAACDLESSFSASEIKRFFVNVTNVVHTPKGEAGYQPMFYDAMVNPSSEIRALYESKVHGPAGRITFEVGNDPAAGARKLKAYVADLFTATGKKPYRTRIAGRELLVTEQPKLVQQTPLPTVSSRYEAEFPAWCPAFRLLPDVDPAPDSLKAGHRTADIPNDLHRMHLLAARPGV
jgi:hypothetical protein